MKIIFKVKIQKESFIAVRVHEESFLYAKKNI